MLSRPFVNDGLWRTLCPRFSSQIIAASADRTGSSLPRNHEAQRVTRLQRLRCQLRTYTTSSTSFTPNGAFFSSASASVPSFSKSDRPPLPPNPHSKPARPALVDMPTSILYEHVRAAGAKGQFDNVMNICRILVRDRGEPLNKHMYNAMLHSFVSDINGTAGKARQVLVEMSFFSGADSQGGIELDARGCECVLEVLAVHPDYLLRDDILEHMKARWFSLSDRAHHFVVAGMLRERHFEQALEMLEDMVRSKVRVADWLFDVAMWTLLEYNEVEEAFYVLSLKERVQTKGGPGTARLSDALWGALLDAAGQRQMHEAASMIWTTQVQPGYLKPATGACNSVLALAARHGDVQLATDVFRVLTERETSFTPRHYELLITTYLKAGDLSAALSVILIMVDANLKVDEGTCNPLYQHLSLEEPGQPSRPMAAFTLLQDFEAAGRKVPTSAVNACIQASIALTRFEEAIEIYKALHTVSSAGPNTQTFNMLFKGCKRSARKELAMFFVNEMIQLGLRPDRITYDRLMLVCLQANDLEDALLYYQEMRQAKMKPRQRTWELLLHKCVVKGDERAMGLLREYKEGVEEPRSMVEKAVVDRFEYGILPIVLGNEPETTGGLESENGQVRAESVGPGDEQSGSVKTGGESSDSMLQDTDGDAFAEDVKEAIGAESSEAEILPEAAKQTDALQTEDGTALAESEARS